MSKITNALKKAEQERQNNNQAQEELFVQPSEPIRPTTFSSNPKNQHGKAGNSWLVWVFFIGVIITVFVAFNYEGSNETVPLSEIFPEAENYPVDVEYEFVDAAKKAENKKNLKKPISNAPVVQPQTVQQVAPVVAQQVQVAATPVTPTPALTSASPQKVTAPPAKIAPKAVDAPIQTSVSAKFTIQVASFKTQDKAQTKAKELKDKSYPAYIVSTNLGEKGIWYRVYVGEFKDKQEAESYLSKVKTDYNNSFIISPKN